LDFCVGIVEGLMELADFCICV